MKETNTSSDDSYDAIIVGSGIAGSVIANMLAKKLKKILIIEKMHHIGGSTYEETLPNGMRIQKYGPHIFHTDSEEVYNYIIQFGQWYNYRHSVLGNIDGKLVPVPFNFKSIDVLYDKCKACEIKNKLSEYFPKSNCVSISEISNHEDATIKEFGDYIYEKVIKNYTKKQWDNEPKEIDPSIINRVKITLGYNDCYFKDKYQFMPQNGYNDIFKNLLDSPNITVMLGSEARDVIRLHRNKVYFNNLPFDGTLVYTGSIDELFDFRHGRLPYRSIDFKFENIDSCHYQPCLVVNYPNEHKYTRITDFGYLQNNKFNTTTILKEYPKECNKNDTPYYPVINNKNMMHYKLYRDDADKINSLYLCGRLAEYAYYNMDQVVLKALETAKRILH